MKYLFVFLMFTMVGCGYEARMSEVVGQPKKVINRTPLLCDNRIDADISLGVMRNGVGSMSTEDMWVTVPNAADQALLADATANGKLVKMTYDVKRFVWCWYDHIVTHVELLKD